MVDKLFIVKSPRSLRCSSNIFLCFALFILGLRFIRDSIQRMDSTFFWPMDMDPLGSSGLISYFYLLHEQCKFSEERFIILYLRKFGRLLGVDHSTLFFYCNFLFRLLQFNSKFYLTFPIVVTIIYYHSNCSIRI